MKHLYTYKLVMGLCCLCCSTAAGTIANNSYNLYRLPTSIQPECYNLKVITYLKNPSSLRFDGQVTIRFKVLVDTTNITLHSRNLTIDESRITLQRHEDNQTVDCVLNVTSVLEQDLLIIQLSQTLYKDQTYRLELYFSGLLNKNSHVGYYRSSYVLANRTKSLSATKFETGHARAAFPCMDEPDYTAQFVIWLGHHKSLKALSNMALEKMIELTKPEDYVWSIFKKSDPMSTSSVAYTVNDFKRIQSEMNSKFNNKVLFRTWARADAINQCKYANKIGLKILKYFEDIFRVPFPLEKVDQIVIPDFSFGATENWGLITYREPILLFAPNVSSNFNKLITVRVISHEIAHQWFANLVTTGRSDSLVNKGFATYMTSLGVQHLIPEWDFYNMESLDNTLITFHRDAQLSFNPLTQTVLNDQMVEIFDSISHRKVSAVLRMLHLILEDKDFFEAIRDYLNNHKEANAVQEDLWAAFSKRYNSIHPNYDMKIMIDSWTLQNGFPVVRVTRDYQTGSVEISQERFLIYTDQPDQCWWLPLSYTTASEMNFITTTPQKWLECDESGESENVNIDNLGNKNEWVLFNIQLSGIYRVLYDKKNWKLLTETLRSENFTQIHVMNRAQLIDDSIWLAWSTYLEYSIPFNILDYLKQEHHYLPWKVALDGLSSVDNLLKSFEKYDLFKRCMHYIIKPIYDHLGGVSATEFEDSKAFTKVLHKSLIARWACHWEMNDCVQNSLKYFKQWKSSSENNIPLDLRYTVSCTAIHHGTEEDWQFLLQRYKESNVATEKNYIIFALGCSNNTETLRYYMDITYTKTRHIRKQDATSVFISVARNRVGFPIALAYFIKKFDKLNAFYGSYSKELSYLLSILASQITTSQDQDRLSYVVKSKKNCFENSEKTIESALETMKINLQWIVGNVKDASPFDLALNYMNLLNYNL